MAEIAGKTNVVKIATSSSEAGTQISGVDDSEFEQLCDLLDITEFGDSYKKDLAGLLSTSGSLSGNYDPDDTNGQLVLVPGNTVWIQALPDGSTGKKIKAMIEKFSQKASATGKQTFSCSYKGQEAPTAVT